MEIKGAIFDMDGVLFDTEQMYRETWNEIADSYGITLDGDFVYAVSGTNGEQMCRVVEQFYHVPDGSVIVRACKKRLQEKLAIHVPVKKGVRELLEFFRSRNIPVALASSSNIRQIRFNLESTNLDPYFDEIVSGEHVQRSKPAPDIFLHAARQIGCRPEQCLVFEDSFNGVRAGHEAGCVTIMIPDLVPPTDEIAACCAGVYPDLEQFCRQAQQYVP